MLENGSGFSDESRRFRWTRNTNFRPWNMGSRWVRFTWGRNTCWRQDRGRTNPRKYIPHPYRKSSSKKFLSFTKNELSFWKTLNCSGWWFCYRKNPTIISLTLKNYRKFQVKTYSRYFGYPQVTIPTICIRHNFFAFISYGYPLNSHAVAERSRWWTASPFLSRRKFKLLGYQSRLLRFLNRFNRTDQNYFIAHYSFEHLRNECGGFANC